MTGKLHMHPKLIEMELEAASRESQQIQKSPEFKARRAAELMEICKEWRAKSGLTASRAAQVLGVPKRTYENIEQGRGFPYPTLLILAIRALD